MTLTEARQAVADVLNSIEGIDVRPRPFGTPRVGDGWVVISSITPSTFTGCLAVFTAVLCLGSEEAKAEERLESLGIEVINVITKSDLNATDVSAEPAQAAVGVNNIPMYVIALSLTLEVG